MADARRKDAIWTAHGNVIRPLDPRPEDITIEDIAHSLANQCRFTGHTKKFYSVAQHSVLVSEWVEEIEPQHALTGLIHDASEAYLSDIARPIKRWEGSEFGAIYEGIENRLMEVISEKFGTEWPMPPIVVQGDDMVLRSEAKHLMPKTFPLTRLMQGNASEYWPARLTPWSPVEARNQFLWRYQTLTKEK